MRVLLVGRPGDRDRVRGELVEAGLEIVAESAAAPDSATHATGSASHAPGIDAIVTALPGTPISERRDVAAGKGEALTPRELDVLALLAEGLPNKAIAHSLGISDQTVKFHVAAIIGKLGAANRTDAVRRAFRRGLVAI